MPMPRKNIMPTPNKNEIDNKKITKVMPIPRLMSRITPNQDNKNKKPDDAKLVAEKLVLTKLEPEEPKNKNWKPEHHCWNHQKKCRRWNQNIKPPTNNEHPKSNPMDHQS